MIHFIGKEDILSSIFDFRLCNVGCEAWQSQFTCLVTTKGNCQLPNKDERLDQSWSLPPPLPSSLQIKSNQNNFPAWEREENYIQLPHNSNPSPSTYYILLLPPRTYNLNKSAITDSDHTPDDSLTCSGFLGSFYDKFCHVLYSLLYRRLVSSTTFNIHHLRHEYAGHYADIIGHFNEDSFMLQKDSTVLCNEIPRERFRSFRKTSPFCSS